MFIKSFILLASFFIFIDSQTFMGPQIKIKKLKKFIDCIIEKTDLGNIKLEGLMYYSPNTDYKQYQKLFTDNYNKTKICTGISSIPQFPDGTKVIDINAILKNEYNWATFISCLINKDKLLDESPLQNLIDYINEEEYYDALKEEFKLKIKGNLIINQCSETKIKAKLK